MIYKNNTTHIKLCGITNSTSLVFGCNISVNLINIWKTILLGPKFFQIIIKDKKTLDFLLINM
jgi:hypothetical protein